MPTPSDLLRLAISQDGDKYVFGHEVRASQSNPAAFDCSELVQWACARLGVKPTMPDGSWIQWQHCHKHSRHISVKEAINTPGALLFHFGSSPAGRSRPHGGAHVAISQGNGRTIEARGSRWGVGQWNAGNRFNYAGLIPGIDYDADDEEVDTDDVPTVVHAQPHLPYLRLKKPYTKSDHVLTCQIHLNRHGASPRLEMDGVFGPKTEQEVKDFQKHERIAVDGIVGPVTWSHLLDR